VTGPVLVDRMKAIAILNVTASTFDRLCHEGCCDDWQTTGALSRPTTSRSHLIP